MFPGSRTGRYLFHIFLGNLFSVINVLLFILVCTDGTSVIKGKVEMRAPRLHYVHPRYFEAGKPMEFVACGSDLLQPKFR